MDLASDIARLKSVSASIRPEAPEYRKALLLMRRKEPNLERVYKLLIDAMGKGDPRAVYALATWYLYGRHVKRNLKHSARLLAKAAEGGMTDAMFDLAVSYEKGMGVRQNEKRAAQLYLKAALYGDPGAGYEVGRCLYYGIGFARDRAQAKIWLDQYAAFEYRGRNTAL
jgi:TPR repeat protein